MIGGGPQKITIEIGGQIAASLGRSLKAAQMQVSSFGRNVSRTMNDAALSGRKSFKGMFDNALWQQAAAGAATLGVGLAASVRTAADFEKVLSEIGKTANVSGNELKGISKDLLALSGRNRTNLGPKVLAEGVQDLVAQGLSLNDAVASIESLGRVATATNSDLLDVTKTGFQLQNALKIRPTELKATFDALAFAGKQGAFELKDMAQFMPTIAAAAGTMGIQGKQGAIALASMMQMVRKDAPDAGQAATRLTDAMLKMTAPDAVKNFKKFGVNIEQVLKNAKKKGINPMEAALSELQRITGGDTFKLGQIFGDKEAKLGLMSLMKYRKEYEKLKAESGGAAAAGTVDKDYQRSLQTFQGTLTSFQNSAQRLGISVGNALLPPLTRLAEIITPVVEGIADWAAANPGLMTGIVAIGGAFAGLVIALPIIAGIISAVTTIGTAVAAAMPIIAGIGTVFAVIGGIISGPVLLAIVGVGAAIAAIALNWGFVKQAGMTAWASIQAGAASAWNGIKAGAASAWAGIQAAWGQFTAWISGVFNAAVNIIQQWGPRVLAVMFPIPALIISQFQQGSIGQKIIGSIIDGLKAKWAALVGWITGAWAKIKGFIGGGGDAPASAGPTPPGRAVGGPVTAGQPYIVGERRRELFVPGMDGAIIPRIARPATGGGGVTINAPVTINAAGGNADGIREQVRLAFEDLIARAYGDYRVALND